MEPTKIIFLIGAILGVIWCIIRVFYFMENKEMQIKAIVELSGCIVGLILMYMLLFNKAIQGLILIFIWCCPVALGFLIFILIYKCMGK